MMQTIAFFNNKGGVGKTSLAYHLAWMFSEMDYRVIAADLDPQANLSGMFVDEERLADLWAGKGGSNIDADIAPLFEGTGDITHEPHIEIPGPAEKPVQEDIARAPHIEKMGERVGLLVGNLNLSKREDELSATWPACLDRHPRAFRVMTAFSRLIEYAAKSFAADVVLIDVGPNFGAVNRAALITSEHVVIPLAPDLFSLQGLDNVGPVLHKWREDWAERKNKKPENLSINLPGGCMQPAGYVIMRHSVRLSRAVKAYDRWIEKIPATYAGSIVGTGAPSDDAHCLAHLKDYRSLMPLAQEARKPMFLLKPGDGAIGGHQNAVQECRKDFAALARRIIDVCGVERRN